MEVLGAEAEEAGSQTDTREMEEGEPPMGNFVTDTVTHGFTSVFESL